MIHLFLFHRPRLPHTVHLDPHLLIRRQAAFPKGGNHITIYKFYIGKTFPQNRKHQLLVISQKKVLAADKQQNRLWPVSQLFNDICHTVNHQLFHATVQHIFFTDLNRRIPVQGIHLRRCQHHSPQTSQSTDKNLMRLRYQHSGVNNIPVSPGRRTVLQSLPEGSRKGSLSDRNFNALRIPFFSDSFQHKFFPVSGKLRTLSPIFSA